VSPPLSITSAGRDPLTFDAQFDERASADDVATAVRDIERRSATSVPKMRRIYIEAVHLRGAGARRRSATQTA